jgi:hypothetical protein
MFVIDDDEAYACGPSRVGRPTVRVPSGRLPDGRPGMADLMSPRLERDDFGLNRIGIPESDLL